MFDNVNFFHVLVDVNLKTYKIILVVLLQTSHVLNYNLSPLILLNTMSRDSKNKMMSKLIYHGLLKCFLILTVNHLGVGKLMDSDPGARKYSHRNYIVFYLKTYRFTMA